MSNLLPLLSGDKHRLTLPIDQSVTIQTFYNRLSRDAKPYALRIRNNGNGTVDLWICGFVESEKGALGPFSLNPTTPKPETLVRSL